MVSKIEIVGMLRPSKHIQRSSQGNSKFIYLSSQVKCKVKIGFIELPTYYKKAPQKN
jgi:hypothetical protein